MSGGTFNYHQYHIKEIIERIEEEIKKNDKLKSEEELQEDPWGTDDWYNKYPEDLSYYKYPDDIINEFKNAVYILKKAYIYAQRIDYLLASDDGEDNFRKRLKEELKELENGKYSNK